MKNLLLIPCLCSSVIGLHHMPFNILSMDVSKQNNHQKDGFAPQFYRLTIDPLSYLFSEDQKNYQTHKSLS